MKYKILYIEDQEALSISHDLKQNNFEVETDNTNDFNTLLDKINNGFDAFLLDYKLTENKGRLDAPAIAQAIRTKGGLNFQEKPIFLISDEDNLPIYDKDLLSQRLFDFAISKTQFREDKPKYSKRIQSFIKAYAFIKDKKFKINEILGIDKKEIDNLIDYRFIEKTNSVPIKNDIYSLCYFINNTLIRGIGPLIGDDVLAARLGVDKLSEQWPQLIYKFKSCKYSGILSDVYNRWWMDKILVWWDQISKGKSLRIMTASERVKIINKALSLNLKSIEPIRHAQSTNYWTICKECHKALDPSEGYIINQKDLFPWQEMEYLSLNEALEQSKYYKYLSPFDKLEIREIGENATL